MLDAGHLAFAGGDFSTRLPNDWSGVDARIAEAFNQSIANAERIVDLERALGIYTEPEVAA